MPSKCHGSAICDTRDRVLQSKANASKTVIVLPSKEKASESVTALSASQSVSHAAIGDTSDTDVLPSNANASDSVSSAATPNAEDVAATTPDMPRAWSDTSMEGDPEDYVRELVFSIAEHLRARLSQEPNKDGKFVLEGSLNEQRPIDVANAGQNTSLKSYKEPWKGVNCIVSLEANGLYEAAGNAFWLNPARRPDWDGHEIPGSEISWAQIAAGRSAWSEETLLSSADTDDLRHYVVHGVFPTAIPSAGTGASAIAEWFEDLPCFSGRAVLLGWYSTMDDQLRTDNMPTIMKLYEAMLSMPIRMRVGPTMKQIVLDTISYAEDIFAAQGTTADSCLDFVSKVRVVVDVQGKTQRQLVEDLKLASIVYHGKPIGDQGVRCIQTVEPYAANGAVRAAARNLEPETKKLNEQTLMLKLCAACNKQYGKATTAAIDACVKVLVTLRFALKYKCNIRIENDTHLTEEYLTGKSIKKGQGLSMLLSTKITPLGSSMHWSVRTMMLGRTKCETTFFSEALVHCKYGVCVCEQQRRGHWRNGPRGARNGPHGGISARRRR